MRAIWNIFEFEFSAGSSRLEIARNGVESDEEAAEGHDRHNKDRQECHRDGGIFEDARDGVRCGLR